MAKEIAIAKGTAITALTYYPDAQHWQASFGAEGAGCSHVIMNRIDVPAYLKEYDANWHPYEIGDDEDEE